VKKREHAMRPHLPSLANEIDVDSFLFLRLCHHCLYLNESGQEVLECDRCRKVLTVEPFVVELEANGENPLGKNPEDSDFEDFEGNLIFGRKQVQNQYRGYAGGTRRGLGLSGLSVLW
jgi:hypothetical protein